MLGHTLGAIPLVQRYFDKVILLIILVSFIPVLLEFLRSRRAKAPAEQRPESPVGPR
jgi:hypothetical protein